MAATKVIEEQNCRACGVDIREAALFCYNCGNSVTPDETIAENNDAVSDVWFRDDIAKESSEEKNSDDEKAETTTVVRKKRGLREPARLRSAAALRRKSRNLQRKRVEEVVWEEYENPSNGKFIAVAIIFAVLTGAIFLLAIYLK